MLYNGLAFERFWLSYPRKTHKKDAEKAWKSLKIDQDLFRRIMVYLDAWKATPTWKDSAQQRFIPYPASWLRAETWNDDSEYTDGLIKDGSMYFTQRG